MGSSLAVVQATTERYSLTGTATAPQRAALAGAAQLSDELLSRGVLFGCAAMWVHSRLVEGGLGDATLWSDGPELWETLQWGVAAAIVVVTGLRFSHHAADKVSCVANGGFEGEHVCMDGSLAGGLTPRVCSRPSGNPPFPPYSPPRPSIHPSSSTPPPPSTPQQVAALQAERRKAETAVADRSSVLRYQPLATQHTELVRLQQQAAEAERRSGLLEPLERAVALLLGGRAMLGAGATYAAFLLTDGNLLASFTAGLSLQLAAGALCAYAAERRGSQPNA